MPSGFEVRSPLSPHKGSLLSVKKRESNITVATMLFSAKKILRLSWDVSYNPSEIFCSE